MVVDKTLVFSSADQRPRHLSFPPEQHPIVLQLGGSEPQFLRQAGAIAAAYGYDEVNLNCGCPSDRVAGAGCFGAALMLDAERVAACCAALHQGLAEGCEAANNAASAAGGGGAAANAGSTSSSSPATPLIPPPVSVKCRLGVDDADTYSALREFVRVVSAPLAQGGGGVSHFVIHARKCLLNGLTPAQNRSVPPLRHEWLWALKRDFPELRFTLNGGVASGRHAAAALACREHGLGRRVPHGVMIGRAAVSDPWGCLAGVDELVFGDVAAERGEGLTRRAVVDRYCEYADAVLELARRRAAEVEEEQRAAAGAVAGAGEQQQGGGKAGAEGGGDGNDSAPAHQGGNTTNTTTNRVWVPSVRHLARPLVGLFHGAKGGRRWRAALDEAMRDKAAHRTVRSLMDAALAFVPPEELDREAPSYAASGAADAALEQGRREAAEAEAAEEGDDDDGSGGLPLWWEWTGAADEEDEEEEQQEQAVDDDENGGQQQQDDTGHAAAHQPLSKPAPLLPPYRLGPLPGPSDRAAGDQEASDLRAKDARRAARRQQRRQQRDQAKATRKRAAKEAAVAAAGAGAAEQQQPQPQQV
jgi:tRNA-dihydrouridine synthase A